MSSKKLKQVGGVAREEILAIAAALKDVFLGAQASNENVKKIDLRTRCIVAFAIHGLIP